MRPSFSVRICEGTVNPVTSYPGGSTTLLRLTPKGRSKTMAVALHMVAFRVLVGFDDDHATLAMQRHRPRQRDLDVVGVQIRIGHQWIRSCLRAADHLKMQRRAAHRVIDALLARGTALANGVVEKFCAGRRRGHFIVNLETRGLGSEQLVTRVLIRFGLPDCGREIQSVLGSRLRRLPPARPQYHSAPMPAPPNTGFA